MARSLQLQVILDAVDRATGPMKNLAKGSAGAGAAIRQTRDHLRELQDQQKRISAFQDMTRQAKASRGALTDKRKELAALTSQISASDNPSKRLIQQQQRAQREVDQLSKRYRDQTQRSRELQRELPAKAQGIKNLGHQQSDLAKRIEAANRTLGQQQEALRRLGDADVSGKYRNMSTEVGRLARRTMVMGGAAAGGIFAWARSTATLGDEVAHTADRIGVARDVLQEIRFAGARGGGMDVSAVDASMLTFTRRIGHAARGTGAAVRAYDELGLSADALARMKPEKALGIVADRLAEIEDHNEQLSYASQIFDTTGGANMLKVLKAGSAGLEEFYQQSRQTGYILDAQAIEDAQAFNDALDDTLLSLKGMKNIVGAELMPVVTDLMQNFRSWLVENRAQVQDFAKSFGSTLKSAVPTIIDLAKGAGQVFSTLARGAQGLARLLGGFDRLAILMAVIFASKAIIAVLAFGFALVKAVSAIFMLSKTLGIAAGAAKLFSLTLMGTPIGWLMAGIALLAGGVYLIYRNWDGISNWFAQRWQSVKDSFGSAIAFFTGLPDQFRSFGSAMIDGLIGGILGKATALRDAITGAAGKAVAGFKNLLGINSPSKVFAEFGVNTMEGYQQGIQRTEAQPLREITGIAKRLQQAGAGLLLGTLSTVATALPSSIGVDMPRMASIPLDTRGPLSPSAGAGGLVIQGGININVTARPGMDEQALARHIASEVQRALADAQHQASARQRSALYDTD